MISDHQISWLKEFLLGLCDNAADRSEMEEIVDTFRKLWRVAKAAEQNPYPRSPRLIEAIAATKGPGAESPPRPGAGSL